MVDSAHERSSGPPSNDSTIQGMEFRPQHGAPLLYESILTENPEIALNEGSRHFEGDSAVQKALQKIAGRLEQLGIPYAVAGGMALFSHGLRRFTEDVDVLVTREGLKEIHKNLAGLGYVTPFAKSKNLRDAEFGVRIEFLIAGQFPGDGKPKPVAFPDPETVSEKRSRIKYLNLPTLVELKLASGMTSPQRLKDLADVQELIKLLDLPETFAEQLDPYVHTKFEELWTTINQASRRYQRQVKIDSLSTADLRSMRDEGVTIEEDDLSSGQIRLVTSDPKLAKKYDLHDEAEFWDDG